MILFVVFLIMSPVFFLFGISLERVQADKRKGLTPSLDELRARIEFRKELWKEADELVATLTDEDGGTNVAIGFAAISSLLIYQINAIQQVAEWLIAERENT